MSGKRTITLGEWADKLMAPEIMACRPTAIAKLNKIKPPYTHRKAKLALSENEYKSVFLRDRIVEMLAETNAIADDLLWQEANLPKPKQTRKKK